MADIAQLGVKVTQEGIGAADAALAKLQTTTGKTQRQVEGLETKLVPLNEQFTRVGHNAKAANDSLNQFGQHADRNAGGVRTMRLAAQQAGYQVQDFAVQVQGGTSAMVAFGQQGSQLLGIFGPGGAIAGAMLAVGSAIYTGISATTKKATGDVQELMDKLDDLTQRQRAGLVLTLEDNIKEKGEEWDDFAAKLVVSQREVETLQKRIKDLKASPKGLISQIFLAGQEDALKDAQNDVIKYGAAVDALKASVEEMRKQQELARNGTNASTEAVKNATSAYTDLMQSYALQIELLGKTDSAQAKTVALHKLGIGATTDQIAAINAEIDAYYRLKDAIDYSGTVKQLNDQLTQQTILLQKGQRESAIWAQVHKLGTSATKEQKDEIGLLAGKLFDVNAQYAKQLEAERKLKQEREANKRAIAQFDKQIQQAQIVGTNDPQERLLAEYKNKEEGLKKLKMSEDEYRERSIKLWEVYYNKQTDLSAKHAQVKREQDAAVVQMNLNSVQSATQTLGQYVSEGTALGKAVFVANQALAAGMVFNQYQVASAAAMAAPPLGLGPVAGAPLAAAMEAKMIASMGAIAAQTVAGVARVQGGDTPAGVPVTVGERGPEKVIFDKPAAIVPNGQLGDESGATYITQQVTQYIQGNGDEALKQAVAEGARQGYQMVYKDFKGNGNIKKVARR